MLCVFGGTSFVLPPAHAQEFTLPPAGEMVRLSTTFDPPVLKGIKVDPDDPLRLEFILDKGTADLDDGELKGESTRLIRYFLASLTVPEKDLWVNLSPYEKNRIIPDSFGLTAMGRDLLAEDYLLKQITASLIYPKDSTGRVFWKRIYQEAVKKYGTTNIPVNTFNKVWIVPEKAIVYENAAAGAAYVVESKLNVMLEQDYLSRNRHTDTVGASHVPETGVLGNQIVREVVIPELIKEVNTGGNFARLRQVYDSLILAAWYKRKLRDSILARAYADKNKVRGAGDVPSIVIESIYQRYLQAFKKGIFNYIQEDIDPVSQQALPRKYFSGGFSAGKIYMDKAMVTTTDPAMLPVSTGREAIVDVRLDRAMTNGVPTLRPRLFDHSDALGYFENLVSDPLRAGQTAAAIIRMNVHTGDVLVQSRSRNNMVYLELIQAAHQDGYADNIFQDGKFQREWFTMTLHWDGQGALYSVALLRPSMQDPRQQYSPKMRSFLGDLAGMPTDATNTAYQRSLDIELISIARLIREAARIKGVQVALSSPGLDLSSESEDLQPASTGLGVSRFIFEDQQRKFMDTEAMTFKYHVRQTRITWKHGITLTDVGSTGEGIKNIRKRDLLGNGQVLTWLGSVSSAFFYKERNRWVVILTSGHRMSVNLGQVATIEIFDPAMNTVISGISQSKGVSALLKLFYWKSGRGNRLGVLLRYRQYGLLEEYRFSPSQIEAFQDILPTGMNLMPNRFYRITFQGPLSPQGVLEGLGIVLRRHRDESLAATMPDVRTVSLLPGLLFNENNGRILYSSQEPVVEPGFTFVAMHDGGSLGARHLLAMPEIQEAISRKEPIVLMPATSGEMQGTAGSLAEMVQQAGGSIETVPLGLAAPADLTPVAAQGSAYLKFLIRQAHVLQQLDQRYPRRTVVLLAPEAQVAAAGILLRDLRFVNGAGYLGWWKGRVPAAMPIVLHNDAAVLSVPEDPETVRSRILAYMQSFVHLFGYRDSVLGVTGPQAVDGRIVTKVSDSGILQGDEIIGTNDCFSCAPVVVYEMKNGRPVKHIIHFQVIGGSSPNPRQLEAHIYNFFKDLKGISLGESIIVIPYDSDYRMVYTSIAQTVIARYPSSRILMIPIGRYLLKAGIIMHEGVAVSTSTLTAPFDKEAMILTWDEIRGAFAASQPLQSMPFRNDAAMLSARIYVVVSLLQSLWSGHLQMLAHHDKDVRKSEADALAGSSPEKFLSLAGDLINNFIDPVGIAWARRQYYRRFKTEGFNELDARRNARLASLYTIRVGGEKDYNKVWFGIFRQGIAHRLEREAKFWLEAHHLNADSPEILDGTKEEMELVRDFKLGHEARAIAPEYALIENMRLFFLADRIKFELRDQLRDRLSRGNQLVPNRILITIQILASVRELGPLTRKILLAKETYLPGDEAMITTVHLNGHVRVGTDLSRDDLRQVMAYPDRYDVVKGPGGIGIKERERGRYLNSNGILGFRDYDTERMEGVVRLATEMHQRDSSRKVVIAASPAGAGAGLVALDEKLTELGIPHELYGFSSNYFLEWKGISRNAVFILDDPSNMARYFSPASVDIIIGNKVLYDAIKGNGIEVQLNALDSILRPGGVMRIFLPYDDGRLGADHDKLFTHTRSKDDHYMDYRKALPVGGIDLSATHALSIQNGGRSIRFHLDPAEFQQLQNASGLVPVVINIHPMHDLRLFLGLGEKSNLSNANLNDSI